MKRADGGANIQTVHTNINVDQGRAKMPQETDQERFARTALSSVRITDEESAAVQKTQHRVTLDSILEKIVHEDYEHPGRHPHMTLCILTTDNGYIVIGKSVPADPDNYDQELGKKFAKEDAIRQLWPLEAYLLRERLSV
jgi:hypothetical protein